jgi:hypothetical protein
LLFGVIVVDHFIVDTIKSWTTFNTIILTLLSDYKSKLIQYNKIMSKRSYQYTRNANSMDVLWGNGAGKNQFFQDLLEEHCHIYASEEDSSARESLIDSIVNKIHIRGGRFLNKQASVEPFESPSLSLSLSPPSTSTSPLSSPSPSPSLSLSLSISTKTALLLQNGRDSKTERVDSSPLVSSSIELDASQRIKKVRDGLSRFAKKKGKKMKKKNTNTKVTKDRSMPYIGLPGVVCLKNSSNDVQDITIRGTCYTSKRQITMPTTNTKKRVKIGVEDIANAKDREVETGVAIPVLATAAATAIGGHTSSSTDDILMDTTTNDQATLFFGPLLSSVSSCGYSSSNSIETNIGDIGTIFSNSFDDKRVPPTTDVIMSVGNADNNDDGDGEDEDDISCLTFSNLIDNLDDNFPIPNECDTAHNTGFLTSSSRIGWPMRIDRLTNRNDKENMNMNVLGPFPSPSTRRVPGKSVASSSTAALDPSSIDPFSVPSTRSNGQFQMDKYRLYNNDEKREATDSKICSIGKNFMFANMPTVRSTSLPCVSLFLTTEKEQVVTEDTVMKTIDDPDQNEAMNAEIIS